jgi:uncharacterized protein YhaN
MTPSDEARIERRLDRQDDVLGEIHAQVKATNGRVTKLEIDSAVEQALRAEKEKQDARRERRRSWISPAVAAAGATFGAVVLAHFIG